MSSSRRRAPLKTNSARDGLSSRAVALQKRTAISVACISCRKAKARCDGCRPCSTCVQRQKDCLYPTAPTPTQRREMEQQNQSIRAEAAVLRELFQQLRKRPHAEAAEIFERIRGESDFGKTLRLIQDGDLLIQPSMANTVPDISSTNSASLLWGFAQREHNLYVWDLAPQGLGFRTHSKYGGLVDALPGSDLHYIARDKAILQRHAPSLFDIPGVLGIFDARIYGISAKAWTRVSCEDSRFWDLLQLYFLIDHPFYEFVDRDLFLDDMVEGRTQFCSELLINAILCYACHLSDQVECRSEPWHTRNIGSHFYQEARRLWQLEESNARLTTIQASVVLTVIMTCEGKDKIGSLFILHGITMAKDLGLFQSSRTWETQTRSQKHEFRAAAITVWSLFNYQALLSFHLRLQSFQENIPPLPIPHSEKYEAEVSEACLTAKANTSEDTLYFAALRVKHCELCVQVNDVARIMAPREGSSRILPATEWGEALDCYRSFKRWYESIPSRLSIGANIVPQHISFHVHCHMVRAALGKFLMNQASQGSLPTVQELRSDQAECFRVMRQLVEQHAHLFSFKATSSVWFTFLAMVAANCLETIDSLTSRVILQHCIKGLKEMTEITFIANSVFQSLRASAENLEAGLSSQFWDAPDSPDDRSQELRRIIDNTYSNFPSDYLDKATSAANRSDMILRSLAGMSLDRVGPTTLP